MSTQAARAALPKQQMIRTGLRGLSTVLGGIDVHAPNVDQLAACAARFTKVLWIASACLDDSSLQ